MRRKPAVLFLSGAAAALFAASACAAAAPFAASAGAVVPVQPFKTVGLTGNAQVTVRHGAGQRVTLVRGDLRFTHIVVDEPWSGSLQIDACAGACPAGYRPVVEIVTPEIEGLAVKGDGVIDVAGGFPPAAQLGAAVSGDGVIAAEALPVSSVHAAVHGDGKITVNASGDLVAAVNGQGRIRYFGHPRVTSAANSGGLIQAASGRPAPVQPAE